MKRHSASLLTLIFVAIACLLGTGPAFSEEPSPSPAPAVSPSPDLPFVPVWIGKKTDLSDEIRDQALAGVAAQEPDPQHIVVLIHGWMNNRESSAASFKPTAEALRKLYTDRGQRVAIVGLQWDSYVGKAGTFVPQYALSMVGLASNPYFIKVKQARKTGRHAARQLIFALKDKYPNAHLAVFGHSMGCEVSGHMVGTRLNAKEDKEPAFRFEESLGIDLLCLAGSDLDSGIFSASKTDDYGLKALPRLVWITVPKIFQGEQDNVLALHAMARGQAAMGAAGAKMKTDQWDKLIGGMRIYYDNEKIPAEHAWALYYTPERLSRLVDAYFHLQDPSARSADFEALARAKALPNSVMQLRKALEEPSLAFRLYTLWRLETLVCGGPVHLADGTVNKFLMDAVKNPEVASYHTISNPCKMIKQGFFPTREIWDLARKAYQKRQQKKK